MVLSILTDELIAKLIYPFVEGAAKEAGRILVNNGLMCPNSSKLNRSYTLLCIEVGHLRTKVALLQAYTEGEATGISTSYQSEILSSKLFMGQEGFQFLAQFILEFQEKSAIPIDGLALSLCCPTNSERGTIDTTYSLGWKSNILERLHQETGYSCISVMNDTAGFALGCKNQEQLTRDLSYPILMLTLGGGIGSAILQKTFPLVTTIEVGNFWKVWQNGFEGNPHMLAGQGFFDWIEAETDWTFAEKVHQFSDRIAWIINELGSIARFNSVILGGGYTQYIDCKIVKQSFAKPYKIKLFRLPDVSLYGAADFWLQIFHNSQPASYLINSLQ